MHLVSNIEKVEHGYDDAKDVSSVFFREAGFTNAFEITSILCKHAPCPRS